MEDIEMVPRMLSLALLALLLSTQACAAESTVNSTIHELLERGPAQHLKINREGLSSAQIDQALRDIYRDRAYRPIWLSDSKPNERAEILLSFLETASEEGLNPEEYRTSSIKELWHAREPVNRAKLDLLLTIGIGGYVADAREGRIAPRSVDPKLFARAHDVNIDVVAVAKKALAASDLRAYLCCVTGRCSCVS